MLVREHVTSNGKAKRRFGTEAAAKRWADELNARSGRSRTCTNAYQCGACGWWHVGRAPKKAAR